MIKLNTVVPITVPIKTQSTTTPKPQTKVDVSVNIDKTGYKNTAVLAASANNIAKNNSVNISNNVVKITNISSDLGRILPPVNITPNVKPLSIGNVNVGKDKIQINETAAIKNNTINLPQTIQKVISEIPAITQNVIQVPAQSQNVPVTTSSFENATKAISEIAQETKLMVQPPQTQQSQQSTQNSNISLLSGIMPEDESIFGFDSSFMIPLNPEMSEKSKGIELEAWEKPRVLAIVAENIKSGYPSSQAVIIKRLTSNRAIVVEYTILKKNVFGGMFFYPVAKFTSDELNVPLKYNDIIKSLNQSDKDVFVFVDDKISENSTYVYKIEVTWISNGKDPAMDASNLNIQNIMTRFTSDFLLNIGNNQGGNNT